MADFIEVRVIAGREELDDYRRLLFDVYINELGWKFSPTNPSGIRVAEHRLLDDRDGIATCLGVFSQGRLVGGARLCGRYQGRFEVHGYQPSIGMPAVEGCRFKFEPGDPAEAQLFLVDSEEVLGSVIQNLRHLLRER